MQCLNYYLRILIVKITKIPGLGRFGIFIDDLDLNNITEDEWMEVGKLHLESLVTIIRGNKIDHLTYYNLIMRWGDNCLPIPPQLYKKYGKPIKELFSKRLLDKDDRKYIINHKRWSVDKKCPGMVRVTPQKNQNGDSIGIFGDGELYWHSDGSADPAFTPGVSLMGVENMIGSSTGFCTTVDWYEKQSESFRSELDEMILVHNYKLKTLNPEIIEHQERMYKDNMCPKENSEVPLVIQSPGGIKGLHLGITTFDKIKGISKEESDKVINKISSELFVEKYIYKHEYESNNDILLFDTSITLHNREINHGGTSPNRMAYRIQFEYDKLTGKQYQPFFQKEFQELRNQSMEDYRIARS